MLSRLSLIAMMSFLCAMYGSGQPQPLRSPSRWELLAEGGKGEMRGAPVCHTLSYFRSDPKRLDIDSDLYLAKAEDLKTEVSVRALGRMDDRQIFEVVQQVYSPDVFDKGVKIQDSRIPLTMKMLLVERRPKEFCDIYQIQYDESAGDAHDACILSLNGTKVLKTIDQDNRTWWFKYWSMDEGGPVLLDTSGFAEAVNKTAPSGTWNYFYEINLMGGSLKVPIYRSKGDPTLVGMVELVLSVEKDRIVVRSERWIPAATAE